MMDIAIKHILNQDGSKKPICIETLCKDDQGYFVSRWNLKKDIIQELRYEQVDAKEWINGDGVAIYFTNPGVLKEVQDMGIHLP